MSNAILMPQVGQDLTTGKLVKWHVKPGDVVKKGDIVAIVESEKASFEVEAFAEGQVIELLYEEGDDATVLQPLLFVGAPGAAPVAPAVDTGPNKPADAMAASVATPSKDEPVRRAVRISPLARRLAEQHGISLDSISGSGPSGSIVKRDVDRAAATRAEPAAPAAAPAVPRNGPPPILPPAASREMRSTVSASPEDREVLFDRMRLAIAQRLSHSKRTIPHFYLRASVDVTDLQIRRKAHTELTGGKISVNDVLIKATALTLLEFPNLNAHVADDRVILKGSVNIGVAVALDNRLMVPVIAAADRRPIADIGALVRDEAAAARRGVLKSNEVGSFSISNLGMYGVEVQPIINPPEVGILGVGPITREVREYVGGLHVRDVLSLSLSADHRAVDGAYGARFLAALVATIQTFTFEAN